MKKHFTITFLFLVSLLISTFSFSQQMLYSRVKIFADMEQLKSLAKEGINVREGVIQPGQYLIGDYSEKEIETIKNSGLEYEILITDVSKFYVNRNKGKSRNPKDYEKSRDWEVPENFSFGSMGGHATYDEVVAHLDTMAMLFPNLISIKTSIGQTLEGRDIWMVKISDNPNINEDESEVLYTALHHAREPAGLMTLLFYMYYLLENYNEDELVQYLVENKEMYFIPIVNPDGYVYNETTDPEGGGQWRKNRRDNGVPDCEGVDPNRNYGYMWGYNDEGSSPDPCHWSYRGEYAFSEYETMAIRDFCLSHDIRLTINYHTFGELLIYPWGYINEPTPDNELFYAFASEMTRDNQYKYGYGTAVLYESNGDADDWMYGEQTTKDKIFSFTAELGGESDGYWCSIDRIVPIAQENMIQNILVGLFTGNYATIRETASTIISESSGNITFDVTRIGLQDEETFTISLEPISEEILTTGEDRIIQGMDILETVIDSISYTLQEDIPSGTILEFILSLDNGNYIISDTIIKIFGYPIVIYEDNCDLISNWITAYWDVTTSDYFSPPGALTDSPEGEYNNNHIDAIIMNHQIDIPDVTYAGLWFMSKWDIEEDFDYVKLQIKMDGISWTALEGMHTEAGTINQSLRKPIYEGSQTEWILEEVDLMDYVGNSVSFRFLIETNDSITADGYYFDDFKIIVIDQAVNIEQSFESSSNLIREILSPNPFTTSTTIEYELKQPEKVILTIYDYLGKQVYQTQENQPQGQQQLNWNAERNANGVYNYRLQVGDEVANGKMVKVR